MSLKLINSSPRTSRNITFLEFIPSKPLESADCILFNDTEVDCVFTVMAITMYDFKILLHSLSGTSGRVRFLDLSPGNHGLIIEAKAITGEEAVLRRTLFVCKLKANNLTLESKQQLRFPRPLSQLNG